MENNENEISLKEILQKIIELKDVLIKKWKWIIISSFFLGSIFLVKAFISSPVYTAELTFVVGSSQKNNLGGYANLASKFGLNLGGNSGENSVFDGPNLFELIKSRKVIENVLLSKVDTLGPSRILLLDYYLIPLRESWIEDSNELGSLNFSINRSSYTLQHDSLLDAIQSSISESIEIALLNDESSIIKLSYESTDERFAKFIVDNLIEEVGELYVNNKTEKSNKDVDEIQAKVDSVKRELLIAESTLAKLKDGSHMTIKAQGYLQEYRLRRDIEILNMMYGELVKNLELTKFTLMNQTPLIQIIDTPRYPLKFKKPSKKKYLFIGLFLGGFIACFVIIAKDIYKKFML